MNIYGGNLSFDATDEAIRQVFEVFGQVKSAKVIKDRYTGQSRGFAFVEMPVESQAQTAVKSLNGKEIMGKQIRVQQAPMTRQAREDEEAGWMTVRARTGINGWHKLRHQNRDTQGG